MKKKMTKPAMKSTSKSTPKAAPKGKAKKGTAHPHAKKTAKKAPPKKATLTAKVKETAPISPVSVVSPVAPVSEPVSQPVSLVKLIGEKIFGISSDVVTREKLLDFLSEFLTVEKGGIELYGGAFARSTDPKIKETFGQFLSQTERHAELLTRAIQEIGGDPAYESAGAKIQKQRAHSMLSLEVPAALREVADAENLLIAETKDHADWEFLGKISSKIEDSAIRSIIDEIVAEVEGQEDEHLKFAKQAVDELTMKIAVTPKDVSGEWAEKVA